MVSFNAIIGKILRQGIKASEAHGLKTLQLDAGRSFYCASGQNQTDTAGLH
jgi:hypothetical protein